MALTVGRGGGQGGEQGCGRVKRPRRGQPSAREEDGDDDDDNDDDDDEEEEEEGAAADSDGDADADADDSYAVDRLLATRRRKGGRRQYLVRWLGYSHAHDSWEDEESVPSVSQPYPYP